MTPPRYLDKPGPFYYCGPVKSKACKTSDELAEILSVALDRPIASHPVFANLTGSVLAGLLLSKAVYWTKRAESGWFYKTITQWQEETRLSRYEQETAPTGGVQKSPLNRGTRDDHFPGKGSSQFQEYL